MIKILCYFGALGIIQMSDHLSFQTLDILDLENHIKNSNHLFVLFFETLDGKTEDIHRQFLTAKKMLKQKGIEIHVKAIHKKLSTRLQNMFKVYQVPKVKFFQKGKKFLTFDGVYKPLTIKVWVEKQLKEKPTHSQNIKTMKNFMEFFQSVKEPFGIFIGKPEGKQFNIYESQAKKHNMLYKRTENQKIEMFLRFFSQQKFVKNNDVKEMQRLQEEEIQQYFEKQNQNFQFSSQQALFIIQVDKIASDYFIRILENRNLNQRNILSMQQEIKQKKYFTLVNDMIDKLMIEYPVKKSFFLILYQNDEIQMASKIQQILEQKENYPIFIINSNDQNQQFFCKQYLHYENNSLFILTKFQKDFRKYKLDLDPENFKKEEINEFIERFQQNKQKEFLKSKCPENEENNFFEEMEILCAEKIEEELMKNKNPKLVLFHEGLQVMKTKLTIHLMKENILQKIKGIQIYLYDVNENEPYSVDNKIFPYYKIFLNGTVTQYKGLNFTYEKHNLEYFLSDYLTDEL